MISLCAAAENGAGGSNWGHTLDSLREALAAIEDNLASGLESETSVNDQLDQTERQVALQNQLLREQMRMSSDLRDSIKRIENEIIERESRCDLLDSGFIMIENTRNVFAEASARTYMSSMKLSTWSGIEFLLASTSWRELLTRRSLLNRLQDSHTETLSKLGIALDSLRSIGNQLRDETRTLKARRENLDLNQAIAERIQEEHAGDVTRLAENKRSLRFKLKKLQGNRVALEKLREEITSAHFAIEEMVGRMIRGEPIAGTPLIVFKGNLPWPVDGDIVGKFGLQQHSEFATLTESPGIEISASPDVSVKAIADGSVSSVTWLRGFGNVCIVEHAASYYTVYARLGQTSVTQGATVAAGTPIGYPGFDAGAEDYRIHFELWSGKEKHDPLEWLKKR